MACWWVVRDGVKGTWLGIRDVQYAGGKMSKVPSSVMLNLHDEVLRVCCGHSMPVSYSTHVQSKRSMPHHLKDILAMLVFPPAPKVCQ